MEKTRNISAKLDTRDKDAKKWLEGTKKDSQREKKMEATKLSNGSGGLVQKVVQESYARDIVQEK